MKVKQGGVEEQTEENWEDRDHTHTHTSRMEAVLETERWQVSCRDE